MRPALLALALAALATPVFGDDASPAPWSEIGRADTLDRFDGIAALPDGGVILAGSLYSPDTALDARVLRLGPGGAIAFDATFGDEDAEHVGPVAVLPDGGVALAGTVEPADGSARRGWLLRLDPAGGIAWQRTLPGMSRAHPAVAAYPEGGVIVVGSVDGAEPGSQQAWLMRLDAGGEVVWERRLDDEAPGRLGEVAALPDGGAVIVGSIETEEGGIDGRVPRVDADGQVVWDRVFGSPETDALLRVAVGADGRIFAAGFLTRDYRPLGRLAGLDSSGTLLWEHAVGDRAHLLTALAVLPGGDILAAGGRQEGGARAEVVLLRYSPAGEARSAHAFASEGTDWVPGLATGPEGDVFMVLNEQDPSWNDMAHPVHRFSAPDMESWTD